MKKQLRLEIKRIIARLSSEEKIEKSRKISQLIWDNFTDVSNTFGVFAPLDDEPCWDHFCPAEQIVAYPMFKNQQMSFARCKKSELVEGSDFGRPILGPPKNSPEEIPYALLIPGLAFSLRGERLGRGKGHYDKYLKTYRGTKIGICFKEQIRETIPTDPHDQRVDYLISDDGLYKMKGA